MFLHLGQFISECADAFCDTFRLKNTDKNGARYICLVPGENPRLVPLTEVNI